MEWLQNIQNIVFDLGGVVINLDRSKAVDALSALGIEGVNELLGQYVQKEPFLGLETGRLTAGEFFDLLRKQSNPNTTDTQITDAFNQFLVSLPVERLERLRVLRMAGYRVFALSNTNPVMYNSWISNAFTQEGGKINDYFDGIVTSFQEFTCKPDKSIFETVLRRYGLNGGETLMLDDSDANCKAAAEAGMNALRIGNTEQDDMMAVTSLLLS
ncbi:MAG: HAD family phosphatase [Muribaculaceae bacterium]|nr:HAD family phosphatase [Muribaculaceae bacterium]